MLADGTKWLMLHNQSVLRTYIVIGQFSFSLFYIGNHTGSKFTGKNLQERTEPRRLITGSDQTMRIVHSCSSGLNF